MNILVTGAKGFVGRNLVADLKANDLGNIFEYDKESKIEDLRKWVAEADFIYHLAGVNRPKDEAEFMEGNFGFTSDLLDIMREMGSKAPVLITSSIQAALDNPYGKSKKAGEDLMFAFAEENKSPVYVYRFANLFGKWSRPNYNTVVATFCHKISRNEEIQINNPKAPIELCYIDDVVAELKLALQGKPHTKDLFCYVPVTHPTTVGKIADILYSFKESRQNLMIPDMSDPLTYKLYSTYLSFLPEDEFSYKLTMHQDQRGYFTEAFKSNERGQVSINLAKPGITKGQHWHHSKNEKFLVVQGQGVIRFRKIGEVEIIEYPVSGGVLEVVDIPTGYTHSIVNTGDTDMITVMWANEVFNPDKPDTYYEEV